MQAFQFPLRRALDWRKTQLDLEENKLRQLAARLDEINLAVVKLDLLKGRAETAVRQEAVVDAGDLWALAAYRQRLIAEKQALAERRAACERDMDAQRKRVREAQQQYRLLEKLEQRRREEWRLEAERELENLGGESFLSRWNRSAKS